MDNGGGQKHLTDSTGVGFRGPEHAETTCSDGFDIDGIDNDCDGKDKDCRPVVPNPSNPGSPGRIPLTHLRGDRAGRGRIGQGRPAGGEKFHLFSSRDDPIIRPVDMFHLG